MKQVVFMSVLTERNVFFDVFLPTTVYNLSGQLTACEVQCLIYSSL